MDVLTLQQSCKMSGSLDPGCLFFNPPLLPLPPPINKSHSNPNSLQVCTALHCIAFHCTAQHISAQHYSPAYVPALHCTVLTLTTVLPLARATVPSFISSGTQIIGRERQGTTVVSEQFTLYWVQCTLNSIQCIVLSVQYTVNSVRCTVFNVH